LLLQLSSSLIWTTSKADTCSESEVVSYRSAWNGGASGDLSIEFPNSVNTWTISVTFTGAVTSFQIWGNVQNVQCSDTKCTFDNESWNAQMDAGSTLDCPFLYFYDYDSIGTIEISDVTLNNGDIFCESGDSDDDSSSTIPSEPSGPSGTIFKYDLLDTSFGGTHGAFNAIDWETLYGSCTAWNNELQCYQPEFATQNSTTGEITITATRGDDDQVYSARLESYGIFTTAQSEDIKNRGYIEVRALLPGSIGAFPAIWMLGAGGGPTHIDWPKYVEIDIVELINDDPTIHMNTWSTNTKADNGKHPPSDPYYANADFSKDPLICGLEWNVQEDIGQIDITYWHSWYDLGTESWETRNTTLSLLKNEFVDYDEFLNSFTGDGFTLLINLAEGSDWVMNDCGCSESDILANGESHYVVVQSAKVYGF